jgi:cytochrome c
MRKGLAIATLCIASAGAVQADNIGDAKAGEKHFKLCKSCHQVGPGAKNRVGPQLNGLFGRKAGSVEGFKYSKGMMRAADGGLEWHAEQLHAYLENPKNLVSGTRMNFRGMKDVDERADLIAYLRTFSDNPRDIPESDPTARGTDHDVDPEILAIQGDPEYGQYLSSECVTCHQIDGDDDGIPSITFWPEEDFVVALHAYKSKKRAHPVMQMIAGRLSDDEIASLAAYFKDPEQ